MDVRVVTKEKGGLSRPLGMTVVPPAREVPVEKLRAIAKGTGLDGLFLADALSAAATHQRGAAQLARAAARQTSREELRQLHESLAEEHASHLATLESLMKTLGLDPMYVSPAARLAHHSALLMMRVPLLSGSVDRVTMDCALLDLVRASYEQAQAVARMLVLLAVHAKPSSQTDAIRTAGEELGKKVGPVLERLRTATEAFAIAAAMGQMEPAPAEQPKAEQPKAEQPKGRKP